MPSGRPGPGYGATHAYRCSGRPVSPYFRERRSRPGLFQVAEVALGGGAAQAGLGGDLVGRQRVVGAVQHARRSGRSVGSEWPLGRPGEDGPGPVRSAPKIRSTWSCPATPWPPTRSTVRRSAA